MYLLECIIALSYKNSRIHNYLIYLFLCKEAQQNPLSSKQRCLSIIIEIRRASAKQSKRRSAAGANFKLGAFHYASTFIMDGSMHALRFPFIRRFLGRG